jgi:hypothetical protein
MVIYKLKMLTDKCCVFCSVVFKSDFPPPGNRQKNKRHFTLMKKCTSVAAMVALRDATVYLEG